MNRRELMKALGVGTTGFAISPSKSALAFTAQDQSAAQGSMLFLNLNENAWGPSAHVSEALMRESGRLSRYADSALAASFIEQVAAYEQVSTEQIIPGEILGDLGRWLGMHGHPGSEFLYSTPGYTALIDTAVQAGGKAVAIPLNARYENDLQAFRSRLNEKTRAIYLINPHNPTGTLSGKEEFFDFVRTASQRALVIVDEAYLEFTDDFEERSAVSLVRQGANILVFRTFDKIYGLAGMPIGYSVAPAHVVAALKTEGYGDPESLGRLNLVAASAALADQAHRVRVHAAVAEERARWHAFFAQHRKRHTAAEGNFVFFDAEQPQATLAAALAKRGVVVGRAFPPYETWVRITIGLPQENLRVQSVLEELWS